MNGHIKLDVKLKLWLKVVAMSNEIKLRSRLLCYLCQKCIMIKITQECHKIFI